MFKNSDSVKKTSLHIAIAIMTSLKISIATIRSKEHKKQNKVI